MSQGINFYIFYIFHLCNVYIFTFDKSYDSVYTDIYSGIL